MTETNTLQLVGRLAGFVAILQTAELLSLKSWLTMGGVWDCKTLREDYRDSSFFVRTILDRYFGNSNFRWMLWFRLIVSAFVVVQPDYLGIFLLCKEHKHLLHKNIVEQS